MSLYLKVQRFGAASRLLRFRSFAISVGTDPYGVLCTGSPEKPQFTIFSSNGNFFLTTEQAGILLRGAPLEPGQSTAIVAGDILHVDEYTMTAYVTSEDADFFQGNPNSAPQWGHLELTLAGLRQFVPLWPGNVTVGSSPDDTVHLPLPGVLSQHLIIEVRGETITILAPLGEARLASGEPLEQLQTSVDTSVSLEPLGIVLLFKRLRCPPALRSYAAA
ncbi:MAG: hypothetical protein EBZ48_11490 [Proteobacteria bacterium]|nr:hypothetical protein [Pseudomonadota bacterium]